MREYASDYQQHNKSAILYSRCAGATFLRQPSAAASMRLPAAPALCQLSVGGVWSALGLADGIPEARRGRKWVVQWVEIGVVMHNPQPPSAGASLPGLGSTGPQSDLPKLAYIHDPAQPPPELSQSWFTGHLHHSWDGRWGLCRPNERIGLCSKWIDQFSAHI